MLNLQLCCESQHVTNLSIVLLYLLVAPVWTKRTDVFCNFNCPNEIHATTNNEKYFCKVTAIEKTIWSSSSDKTAPKPNNFLANWYLHNVDRKISFNLTWSMDEMVFVKMTQQSFIMGMIRESYLETKFLVEIQQRNGKPNNNEMHFQLLHCHSEDDNSVQAGYEYSWSIMTLPIYQKEGDKQRANTHVNVPCCCSELLNAAVECLGVGCSLCNRDDEYIDEYDTEETHDLNKDDDPSTIPMYVISGFCIVVLLVGLWFWAFRKKKGPNFEPVLVIINTFNENEIYLRKCSHIIALLKKICGITVESNLFNQNIPLNGTNEWITKEFNRCGHLVLICTTQGYETLMLKDPVEKFKYAFPVCVQLLKSNTFSFFNKKTVSLVYLKKEDLQYVPKCSSLMPMHLQYKKFVLDKDLCKLIKHVSGCSTKESCTVKETTV